jgi:Flp pilus assembly protein TadG
VLGQRFWAFWRDRDGTVLVESALVVPVVFTLAFGTFEFSWFFYKQQLIEIGVRDAARYLARIPLTTSGATPCTQVDPATTGTGGSNTTFATYAQNIAAYGNTAGTGTARVSGWSGPSFTCPTTSNSSGTYADSSTIYTIDATTSFADPALGFFGMFGLSAPTISSTHKERYIGPG